ncbi:MAG: peptidoglycan-binding domain-containing protein, partial [Bacillota bacterium]
MKKRSPYYVVIGVIILAAIIISSIYLPVTRAAQPTLFWGSSGTSVSVLQRKLSDWGYYEGSVDGTYGSGTYTAVLNFQRKNRLRVDGVVGPQTWKALGYE